MSTPPPAADPRPALIGLEHATLVALCQALGAKAIHADRLFAEVFRQGPQPLDALVSLDKLPELPAGLRDTLKDHVSACEPQCLADQLAEDGTRKLLLKMPGGHSLETVLIPGAGRITQCISTQAGCAVGCSFCLTATGGLQGNLSSAELVAQVLWARRALEASNQPLRNLVLMGMGEPLHNYQAVASFLRIVTDPRGLAFSPRRVTLSTSGVVPGIYRMIEDALPCNLALSLNATTDETRSALMPINKRYPIASLMTAVCNYIAAKKGRRVLIEYVLLRGVNDTLADAERLVDLLEPLGKTNCTVNLLPFNPFPDSRYERPLAATLDSFYQRLAGAGVLTVVRASKGREISAACGQLKTDYAAKQSKA